VNPVNPVNPVNLVNRDRTTVWHPYTQMLTRPDPIPIVSGKGVYLHTEDGRRLLDGTSSWWVNVHAWWASRRPASRASSIPTTDPRRLKSR
jgi:adenosylmethionine-8-amino-7-oxononanoate aminotransferase